MKYAYFPGCSLEAASLEYLVSSKAVVRELGGELVEIPDWNCCGSMPSEAVDYLMALALPARNLALVEAMGVDTVVASCSACYLSLARVNRHRQRDAGAKAKLDEILGAAGLSYAGTVKVRHLLDVLANDFGPDAVKARVKRPFRGLKVAPYYGCQTVRPHLEYDSADFPTSMDRIIEALGGEVVPYNFKTRCCGGTMAYTARDAGLGLVVELFSGLGPEPVDCFATVCQLCQMNLDTSQGKVSRTLGRPVKIPVMLLTQLMGLAFDLPDAETLLKKNIVSPRPILEKRA
ncbi:MAG: CoB--CoM heterodisulfide reductase iron-sulfur subunit B family protein [Acidobacteria bacterium]|nr:CoB--CoM heterodisulfide reductase iron-sulfur subunit B family protein [Acidobacteriota bacterium]